MPNIRLASEADALPISELCQNTIRTTNSRDYPPNSIELTCLQFTEAKVREKMLVRNVYCAEVGGTFAGTVSFGDGKLHSLFIAPTLQGRRLGRLLVEHVEALARVRGLTELHVHSSITAQAFYVKLGYMTLKYEERKDGSTYFMWKELR